MSPCMSHFLSLSLSLSLSQLSLARGHVSGNQFFSMRVAICKGICALLVSPTSALWLRFRLRGATCNRISGLDCEGPHVASLFPLSLSALELARGHMYWNLRFAYPSPLSLSGSELARGPHVRDFALCLSLSPLSLRALWLPFSLRGATCNGISGLACEGPHVTGSWALHGVEFTNAYI